MAKSNFPGPYPNETTEDDSMMVRRPSDHLEIASRPSTLRSTHDKSKIMGISHVGDMNSSTRKGR
jgi:hypothetical protein